MSPEVSATGRSPEDAYRALRGRPEWIVERDRIRRDFRFASFNAAIAFVNQVAEVAERQQHHPNIRLHEWCFVELILYSHDEGGISSRDLELALALDALPAAAESS